jgi:hypothetical protein
VAFLRDRYRRKHLKDVVPELPNGQRPGGNWYELVGSSYDRTTYGVLVSLFVGASAGGLLLVRAHSYAPVLPFVITLGVVATAAIALREHDAEGLKRARPSAIRGGL